MGTTLPTTEALALQLYTLRDEAKRDLLGTLKTVAGIGYRAVEFAGLFDVSPKLVRATLDALGMAAAGAHVPLARWEADRAGVLAELDVLGCPYGVVPIVPAGRRETIEQVRRIAALFDDLGRACAQRGLGFAFHHHALEFAPLPDADGRSMFDLLVEETDPAHVAFEADLYWAAVGGVDPAALLARLAGRVPLVHLKDAGPEPGEGSIPADLPVGVGTLPWDDLLPAAVNAGARWFVVEQDNPNPADPLADVATSWRNLTALLRPDS